MRNQVRGFSLMELMIVVAIIGVLAAVAVPSYTGYVQRAQRTEGMAALTRLAAAQEKYFLQNNTYTATLADLSNVSATTENGYYTISVTAADATGFTAKATAAGGQASDDDCATFQIDNTGRKTAKNSASVDSTADCWR